MKRILVFLLALSVLGAFAPVKNGYDIGDTVADFKLKNVDGKMVSLSDFKSSKGAIVVFDCNTCPYSKAYNSRILALNQKYSSQGYPVIAINPNDPMKSGGDSYESNVAQAKEKGYTFPYLSDENQEATRAFGAAYTPHTFVVQRTGNQFKLVYIGAIDDSAKDQNAITKKYVEDAVDALLQGKTVQSTRTKGLGCQIKFKSA
jgi:peroxiredoxin